MKIVMLILMFFSGTVFSGMNEAKVFYKQKQYEKAIHEALPLAENGNVDAEHFLALAYIRVADINNYQYWIQSSANKGHPFSSYMLGIDYLNGETFPKNYQKAKELLIQSSQLGESRAGFTLGVMHEKGLGVSKNINTALSYYLLAASNGDVDAQYKLGIIYGSGKDVTRDLYQSKEWLEKACYQDDKQSCRYLESINQLLQTDKLASIEVSEEYQKAIAGNPQAQFLLALEYYELKTLESLKNSITWLNKSANQNYIDAQVLLGFIYAEDINLKNGILKKNLQKSFKWFQKAAIKGDYHAHYNVGKMYWNGKGVRQDTIKALEHFGISCDKGFQEACDYYSRLNKMLLRH